MANFTWEIKRDIISEPSENECCQIAELAAFLRACGFYDGTALEFVSENERIAEYFVCLFERLFSVRMELKEATFDPRSEKDKLTFFYCGEETQKIVNATGILSPHIAPHLIARECCLAGYVRGAFLGSGSCTLPRGGAKTGYHLELVFSGEDGAEEFRELLDRAEFISGIVPRGDKFIVYLKNRDAISDFLSVVGAYGALKKFESVTAAREESNNANRVSNCVAGNADKTAIASAAQIMVLRELKGRGTLALLDESLQTLAEARMQNPTLSLAELGSLLGISKSCLSHRMRKLMNLQDTSDD